LAVLIDSNVIISLLIQSEKTQDAKEILLKVTDQPVTILNVIEEVIYVGLSLIYDCRGFKLRDEIRKGLNDQSTFFLNNLRYFIEEFEIKLIYPPDDLNLLFDTITTYRLLPNDALIAATCKHYGIKKIATFDDDFKRVDFLEVIEV